MNSLNNWCRTASLIGCLILGIEGNLFVHNVATQARLIEPHSAMVEQQRAVPKLEPTRSGTASSSAKVAFN